jgi:hypothetical protein
MIVIIVMVKLEKTVAGLQRPTHSRASTNNIFSIGFTSLLYSVRAPELGPATDAVADHSDAMNNWGKRKLFAWAREYKS